MSQDQHSGTPQVHLKPWRGIHPGAIVLAKWVVLVLAVGIIPSLCHQGERVSFETNRPGMLVSVDGQAIASGPTDAYFASGVHSATLSWGQTLVAEAKFKVRRHILFTWIREAKSTVRLDAPTLSEALVKKLEKSFLTELSERALVFTDSPTYPPKPLFSLYMGMLGSQADPALFKKAAHWATSPSLCKDATVATGVETQPFNVPAELHYDTTDGKKWPYPPQGGHYALSTVARPQEEAGLTDHTPTEMLAWASEHNCQLARVAEVQSALKGKRMPSPLPLPYAWATSDIFDLRWLCTGEVGDPTIFAERAVLLPAAVTNSSGRISALAPIEHTPAIGAYCAKQ